jgi:curved DNA-binding protein CbpA
MEDFVDYYSILSTTYEATEKDIKKAYINKCFILHPDRLQGAPESAKKIAEQELVKVNKAYEILSNVKKRKDYDNQWITQKNKPKPVIEPTKIQLKGMKPKEIRNASFIVRNAGGPYDKISIPNPNTWVRLKKWNSLSNTDELPLQVNIEVEAPDTGKKHFETFRIKLDNEEAQLPVIIDMQNKSLSLINGMLKKIKHDYEDNQNKKNTKISKELKALLLVVSLTILSLGVGFLIKTLIPLWILLGFSTIYSIEKWLFYPTRKYKFIGKMYKLLLNLSILSLFSLTIWSGVELFSKRFPYSPLVASLIFIFEIVIFIWLWKVVSKNSWRWPSMKLTVFSLVCLFMVFSFSGVQPMADLKNAFFDNMKSLFH